MSDPDTDLWLLDRIEDGHAVLVAESGARRTIPVDRLPPGAREGHALRELEEDAGFAIDEAATERLRARAEELRSSLRRGPSGRISL